MAEQPRPRGGTQVLSSVANAARLLREFTGGGELGATELARRLGLSKSTTHRLLHTLAHEGVLEQVPGTGAYRLGPTVRELAAALAPGHALLQAAGPAMEYLRAVTLLSAELVVLDGFDAVRIGGLDGPADPGPPLPPRMPAHTTCAGQVLLAALPEPELHERLAARALVRTAARTTTEPHALVAALARVRSQGWAAGSDQAADGYACAAAPLRGPGGAVVAALGVHGATARTSGDALRMAAQACTDAAAAAARRLERQQSSGRSAERPDGAGGGRG